MSGFKIILSFSLDLAPPAVAGNSVGSNSHTNDNYFFLSAGTKLVRVDCSTHHITRDKWNLFPDIYITFSR